MVVFAVSLHFTFAFALRLPRFFVLLSPAKIQVIDLQAVYDLLPANASPPAEMCSGRPRHDHMHVPYDINLAEPPSLSRPSSIGIVSLRHANSAKGA